MNGDGRRGNLKTEAQSDSELKRKLMKTKLKLRLRLTETHAKQCEGLRQTELSYIVNK